MPKVDQLLQSTHSILVGSEAGNNLSTQKLPLWFTCLILRAQLGFDLATSERISQYVEDSTRIWPHYKWENISIRWEFNSDLTSLREREYLSMLRTQLGSDLATSERIPQYAEDSTQIWPHYKRENISIRWEFNSDLTSLRERERIPQYVEDSTRIRPRYERENTSVRWELNSDLTSLRAKEYLSTLRTQLGSDLATRERIPQYAEDSTRIWPHYKQENTSVCWELKLDPTSLRAREYLSTWRTQLGSDLATSKRIP